MRRESIIDKVERQRQQSANKQGKNTDDDPDTQGDETGDDRFETTYRATQEHMDRLDRAAEQLGLPSRNATITFLTKQKLNELDIE